MIYFRSLQGPVFKKIIFAKCTKHFYFKNGEIGTKKTIFNFEVLIN